MPKSDNFYKIISVVVAVILWTYVVIYVNPTSKQTLTDIPVSLINVENLTAKGLAITGSTDYRVDVTVEGRRGEFAELTAADILAEANVYGFTVGKNYIPIEVTLPDPLKIVEAKPSKIVVNIEELVAVNKPVKVSLTGDLKEDTEIGDITTQPESIEVIGAKSEVNQVQHIKVEAAASKFSRGGGSVVVEAVPVNADGEIVPNVNLSAQTVEVSAKVYSIKEVPLNVEVTGEVANIYEVTGIKKPEKIKMRGTKEALKDMTEIQAEPIDISKITADATIPVKPILPDGVEIANASQKTLFVTVGLKGITTRTFDYSAYEIGIDNLPDTFSVAINADKITIKVSGTEAVMANVSKTDFTPHINLENAAVETTSAAISVKHTRRVNAIEVNPVDVQIILSEVQ